MFPHPLRLSFHSLSFFFPFFLVFFHFTKSPLIRILTSQLFVNMEISQTSYGSSSGKMRKLAIIFFVLGLILAVIGVVLIAVGILKNTCGEISNRSNEGQVKDTQCAYSDEARRSGFDDFLDKVKNVYFELHESKAAYNTDKRKSTDFKGFLEQVKSVYTAYIPKPSKIKKRTDTAWKLLEEVKKLEINKEKPGRENL